jgi:hypothetical protein
MELRKIEWGGMDWIDLAQDKDHWRDLVNTVMKLRDGRAIAQAVSRRLPTAAARVQTRVWSCGIL